MGPLLDREYEMGRLARCVAGIDGVREQRSREGQIRKRCALYGDPRAQLMDGAWTWEGMRYESRGGTSRQVRLFSKGASKCPSRCR